MDVQKVKGWRQFATKFNIRKLIEEGVIRNPKEYGFRDLREMRDFIKGRREYSNSISFKPSSYQDDKKKNPNQPKNIDWKKIKNQYNL